MEAAQPICIAFSNTDVSKSEVLISSNAIGVTGGNEGIITIPRFAGDWGVYRIVFFDKGLSVNAIVWFWVNSNKQDTVMRIENTSNLCEYMFSNCGRTGICFYSIPSTAKVENGSPDGYGGFGIAYRSTSEDYGMVIVFSYSKAVYMKIKSKTWGDWKKVNFIEWLFYIK